MAIGYFYSIGMEGGMALLTLKQQPFVGTVLFGDMPSLWACLTRGVGSTVHRHTLMQESFLDHHAAQRSPRPFRGGSTRTKNCLSLESVVATTEFRCHLGITKTRKHLRSRAACKADWPLTNAAGSTPDFPLSLLRLPTSPQHASPAKHQ